jgi:hypothetical protein
MGNSSWRISRWAVRSAGCVPAMIASVISGARKASGSRLLT